MSNKTRKNKKSIRKEPAKVELPTVSAANATREILIIKAEYDEKRDLVLWSVQDIKTGDKRTLAHVGSRLHEAIDGINNPLTPDQIRFFCNALEGKTKRLVMEAYFKDSPTIKPDASEEEIQMMHEGIDQFPYYEVADKLREEEYEN